MNMETTTNKTKDEKPYIFQVSTKPDISSYKWAGKELSLLSTVLLWTIWFLRALSLCQHIKAIYRRSGKKRGTGSTDNKSGRPNIPPMLGEIYFSLWTILFLMMHIFSWSGIFIRFLAIYYLCESLVWILYYTIFRRFFELGYTIYHRLEYLTVLLLIIPTQALCFSHLYHKSFKNILCGLLGSAGDTTPFPVTVLGCLFAAIVISMIISTFPAEELKHKSKNPKMFVVGCGDVVKRRLYPEITDRGMANEIYDLKSTSEESGLCNFCDTQEEICQRIKEKIDDDDVVWIETPSYAHVSYLKEFVDSKAKLTVVEKPITVKLEELQEVQELIQSEKMRNKIFFLSYYILEKALPLYYFITGNEKFEKYLDMDDKNVIRSGRMLLGVLKSADVHIHEGKDERGWVAQEKNGGQLLETFLHNVLIASLFCGDPHSWQVERYNEADCEEEIHKISLIAKNEGVTINLSMMKNVKEKELKRYAKFVFSGGSAEADFDAQSAKIYFNSLDKYCTISVKKNFGDKYGILVDLVKRVCDGESTPKEVDGLTNQISTIKWLIELNKNS